MNRQNDGSQFQLYKAQEQSFPPGTSPRSRKSSKTQVNKRFGVIRDASWSFSYLLKILRLSNSLQQSCLRGICILPSVRKIILGTLSNDYDKGSEMSQKKICVPSNLTASIWTRSICQMLATFPGVEFLRIYSVSKRGRKFCRLMSTFCIKRQIRRFHVVVVQWTSKKYNIQISQG